MLTSNHLRASNFDSLLDLPGLETVHTLPEFAVDVQKPVYSLHPGRDAGTMALTRKLVKMCTCGKATVPFFCYNWCNRHRWGARRFQVSLMPVLELSLAPNFRHRFFKGRLRAGKPRPASSNRIKRFSLASW
jgi:hypothetical protein